MLRGLLYEVVIGECSSLAKDRWIFEAKSLLDAVQKGEAKRKKMKDYCKGWVIISAKEIGELSV